MGREVNAPNDHRDSNTVVYRSAVSGFLRNLERLLAIGSRCSRLRKNSGKPSLKNDTRALERLVADEYYGVNQWGAKRDKAQLIELFRSFQTDSLVPLT